MGSKKSTVTTLAITASVVTLFAASQVEARSSARADLPCPYGGAGAPNATLWSPTTGASPYNAGLTTGNTAILVAGSGITTDDVGLTVTGATQYDTYLAPIPAAAACTPSASDPGAPFDVNPNGPATQVIAYNLASGGSLALAPGDKEVEFNYNLTFNPTLATTAGTATFSVGGVTYSSVGALLPAGTDNDFLFSGSGTLLGALALDVNGNAELVSGVPTGWTTGGSGGGTTSAPEIDANLAVGAFTLIAGFVAVLRGSRRTLKVVR